MDERPPIGALLREARLRQDLAISDCARATRIRERYLVAIEDGRYESLPDPAYVNGFVRAYATHLGVTIDEPVFAIAPDHHVGGTLPRARGASYTGGVRIAPRGVRGLRRRPWWRRPGGLLTLVVLLGAAVLLLAWTGVLDPFGLA